MFDVITVVSVLNARHWIDQFFFASVPVLISLFFERTLIEIEKIASGKLTRIKSGELPFLVVRSEPSLAEKDGPVLASYSYLHIVNLNLFEEHFNPVWSRFRVRIIQNHDIRCRVRG